MNKAIEILKTAEKIIVNNGVESPYFSAGYALSSIRLALKELEAADQKAPDVTFNVSGSLDSVEKEMKRAREGRETVGPF